MCYSVGAIGCHGLGYTITHGKEIHWSKRDLQNLLDQALQLSMAAIHTSQTRRGLKIYSKVYRVNRPSESATW